MDGRASPSPQTFPPFSLVGRFPLGGRARPLSFRGRVRVFSPACPVRSYDLLQSCALPSGSPWAEGYQVETWLPYESPPHSRERPSPSSRLPGYQGPIVG